MNTKEQDKKPFRQLFFDTETTGFDVKEGHRLVEIGMIEVIDGTATGNQIHYYINPEREVDKDAEKVHGLNLEFLKTQPKFKDVAKEIIAFSEGAELVAHNADFDIGHMNNELSKIGYPRTIWEICDNVLDTLAVAKKAYPRKKNNLDALAERLGIDNSHRTLHGALLDSEILLDVFNKMVEENPNIILRNDVFEKDVPREPIVKLTTDTKPVLRTVKASVESVSQHADYFKPLDEKKMKAKM